MNDAIDLNEFQLRATYLLKLNYGGLISQLTCLNLCIRSVYPDSSLDYAFKNLP